MDGLFQVPSEAPAMDGLVPFIVMVEAVFFCFRMRRVVLDGSRLPDPGLILDGVEDLIEGEPERSDLLYRLVGSERDR